MTAVSYTISDYHNDGHWLTDGTSFGYSVADVRLGGTSPYYETFLRFQLIDIDPGAIIEQAEITLTAVNAPPFATTVRIVGVAQADPPYPTSFADIQGRARTSASVEWTIPAHAENELLTSPNIASVLSELIAQSGWAAGNHILLVIEHVSANYVHRFGALGATTSHPSPARLDIHFTGGGSGQPQSAVFSIGDYLDDGYSIQGGGINNNTTTGYLGQVPGGPHRRPYVRFATNGLAEGDAITAARLKLFPTSSRGPFAVAARVTGDRSAASPTPITSTSDYDSRARTSAFTDFELLTTTAGEPLGGPDGLDVTAIVAELVGDGHPEGAAIQFLIDITSVPGDNYHTISQASATNSASYPPMLEVEWTSSGGQPPGENPLPTVAIIQDYDARATWQPRVAVPGWPFPPAVSDPPSLDVRWQFWLDDGRGRRVALLDDVLSVDIVRAVNAPSQHAIELPGNFDLRLVKKDALIECWRAPVGHPLRLESVFFVRSVTHEANADGVDVLSVTGPDALDLLGRRIVAYPAASPQAAKTGPADDVMKAVVRENLGQLAIAGRSLSALGLMVDPDYGLGAVIEKRFAWRSVLSVLQDLAAASAEAGQPLDFALEPVARADGTLGFRFLVRSEAAAKARAVAIFSRERGNLEDARLVTDWSEEVTYIYAGGQGEEDNREIVELGDARAIAASPWGRTEAFADARQAETTAAVTASAQAALAAGRARLRFTGTLKDAPGSQYGVHWHWGDHVVIRHAGLEFTARARKVRLQMNARGENSVQARMEVSFA